MPRMRASIRVGIRQSCRTTGAFPILHDCQMVGKSSVGLGKYLIILGEILHDLDHFFKDIFLMHGHRREVIKISFHGVH